VKKAILLTFALLCFLTVLPTSARCDEKDVLKALETIKGNTETGVTLAKYRELLASAKVEINMAKRMIQNEKFIATAETCLKEYERAGVLWDANIAFTKARIPHDERKLQEAWANAASLLEKVYASLAP
jgi:DNA-binding transcriptional MerR regulator